jgi:hypothetical protein
MTRSLSSHALLILAATTLALAPGRARAEDVGQIAVIEDSAGRMLPASGICANFMYPGALCIPPAGKAFYASHADDYDMLVFVTNKAVPASLKAGYPLKAEARGIGMDSTPWSFRHFGSAGRLVHALNLGSIQSMPDDPEGVFEFIPISGLEVIGHEIGHHWLAYADVNLDDGRGDLDIIRGSREGEAIIHWSCWLDSDSVMYGGMLTDNGDGTFTDVNGPRRYTQLDQYLMGLRRPDEVEPMWFVATDGGIHGCADWPMAPGVAHDISGSRVDFTIDDVIRAMGPREPAESPCHSTMAFVFVHRPGSPPTAEDLDKVERYRLALEDWYVWATDGRGSLDTRLDGCGGGTDRCPGEVPDGCDVEPDADADADGDTGVDADADLDGDADAEGDADGAVDADVDGDADVGGDADAVDADDGSSDADADDDGVTGGSPSGCGCSGAGRVSSGPATIATLLSFE